MNATTTTYSQLSDAELEAILAAARGSDRRVDPRHALFTAVTLRPQASPEKAISAFSREISLSGIGLLHAVQLVGGESYDVDIRIEDVRVRKNGRIVWCRPVGDGWFLSGCRFE
jgi:hypothetical protein